ncbi:related to DBP6 - ATP-dependent RNA helicase [Ustilago trichophora]|uniref:ATP-dependent RNA helicase n=1 Tax=Ustilago trichophora TaxID=86804 RepID=A0A5C3E4E5_9BASI|nr:related to DBP6 - ATP-dependent RNA helicase [Ustilago trichophora]
MFSIKRFDAFGASSSSSGGKDNPVDNAKLDALNERILKKRKLVQGEAPATASFGIPASASSSSLTKIPSAASAASAASTAARPALNIHPSRLNAAPLLRQSVKKAQTGPREKTKAKQRYLKAKKERRKARQRAAPKKPKTDAEHASAVADNSIISHLPEEEALHRAEAAKKKSKQQEAKSDAASSSDSDSEEDEDEDEDGDSSSDEDESASEPSSSSGSGEAVPKEEATDASMEVEDVAKDEAGKEKEVKALERFPLAGVKKAVDPKLISSLGLPEGLSNRTVVDPTLSRPLPQQVTSSKAAASNKAARPTTVEGEVVVDEDMAEAASDDEGSATISARSTNDDFGKVALSDTVRSRLEALGVSEWFAVQVSVIPTLLAQPQSRSLYRPFAPPRDLCVSAPTGSGKTLAYTVPIVEVLRTRQIVRLRALIVLPTRDLVAQVRSTLELVAKGSGLRIGTATGQHSFAHEQNQLVGTSAADDDNEDDAPRESKVDILIATPGRLIDHLDSTPGFTLAHLRFLVIDEADRLLNQSFQEWLRRVLAATEGKTGATGVSSGSAQAPYELLSAASSGLGSAASSTLQEDAVPSVQKLLFSATLTRDPAKIAALGLRNPHYITVQDSHSAGDEQDGRPNGGQHHERFSLPHSLREHMLITTSADKPFHLLYLLHRPDDVENNSRIHKALCFTKSVDSAARLVKLIEIFEEVRSETGLIPRGGRPLVVKNYSSELKPSDRQRILTQFGQGEIDLLVCSDLISRGIDLPSVEHVVSYDAPIDPAKYVHRVGRTARAGKHGDAWTLVEEQEARHFKKMVRSIVRQTPIAKIKPKKLKEDDAIDYVEGDAATRELRKLRDAYDEALDRMSQFYRNQ